jgi:hypothetical protein
MVRVYLMDIPKRILEELTIISQLAGEEEDWMVIKRLLLLSLPSSMRTLFSTRDPKTKHQALNDFEKNLIEVYSNMTGTRLRLNNG